MYWEEDRIVVMMIVVIMIMEVHVGERCGDSDYGDGGNDGEDDNGRTCWRTLW